MLYVIHFFLYVRKPFQHYGCGGFVRHCTLQNFNQKNIVGEILARLGQMERIDILDKDLTYTVDNRSVIKQITIFGSWTLHCLYPKKSEPDWANGKKIWYGHVMSNFYTKKCFTIEP